MGNFEREVEGRLAKCARQVRQECEGALPDGFEVHLEDIARAIGLDDAAICRVLSCEVLPSERVLELVPTEAALAGVVANG